MKKLSQEMYGKWTAKFNRTVNNEEGSQAVEFMGIAAVVLMVMFVLTQFFSPDGEGGSGIGDLLSGLLRTVSGWFNIG